MQQDVISNKNISFVNQFETEKSICVHFIETAGNEVSC